MARKRDEKKVEEAICAKCRSQSHNSQIYHILSFTDLEELQKHLNAEFTDSKYCVEFFTHMWVTAHQIYGERARELYAPLWLVYLEAHGVEVKNRGDSIMKYRGQQIDLDDKKMIEQTSLPMIEPPKQ